MTMLKEKRQRLEKKGWQVGSTEEFLELSPEESAYIDLKLRLGQSLHHERKAHHLTQSQLARRISSSQSRVAKMEGGDPTVSLDLLVRSLLALGVSNKDLAEAVASTQV